MQQNTVDFSSLAGKYIGVIGDVMLDHFVYGNIERISAEAPIPVVLFFEEKYSPGGAANLASNITALGSHASLFGVTGNDLASGKLFGELEKQNIDISNIAIDIARPTTEKMRIIGADRHLARLDKESAEYISGLIEKELLEKIEREMPRFDAIVISDYAKGVITKTMAGRVTHLARERSIPILVDTKPKHFSFFKNVSVITPNRQEAEGIVGKSIVTDEDIKQAGRILQELSQSHIVMKLSVDGIALFAHDVVARMPSFACCVTDVVGAGDTVVAVLAIALAAKVDLQEAVRIANAAAGVVVEKSGTAVVCVDEIMHMLQERKDIKLA
ncbi:MAG: PfkB family carbohydrate kinase [Patescibacteria group bacterium]